MLSAIRKSDNKKVLAWTEEKSNKPFLCPECSDEVILKKGTVKVHHFAHKPPVTCEYGLGESEEHRRGKIEIYENLIKQAAVSECELERGMGTVRPDISARINGIPVAIEVQISTLSMQQILYRTTEYAKKGIYVLWLSPYTENLKKKQYSPRIWEKWVHATYFGRVYYWSRELEIVPIHFGKHYIHIEERSWYEEGGEERSAGGYDKLSKRYRTPSPGKLVNLIADFQPKERLAWSSGGFIIPPSRLFIDNQPIWWKEAI